MWHVLQRCSRPHRRPARESRSRCCPSPSRRRSASPDPRPLHRRSTLYNSEIQLPAAGWSRSTIRPVPCHIEAPPEPHPHLLRVRRRDAEGHPPVRVDARIRRPRNVQRIRLAIGRRLFPRAGDRVPTDASQDRHQCRSLHEASPLDTGSAPAGHRRCSLFGAGSPQFVRRGPGHRSTLGGQRRIGEEPEQQDDNGGQTCVHEGTPRHSHLLAGR